MRGDRATRVGPASVAQNPRYLAVGPDERDLHAPGRNDAATAVADASHPCAERTLHSKRDAGAVHEYDDILHWRAFCRTGERNADCLMSDLLACDRSTERRLRPPTRGRATMGCRLSSRRLKGKLPLAMELIGDRYRNSWGAPEVLRRECGARFTRIRSRGTLGRRERPRDGCHFSGDGVRFLQAGGTPRVWRTKSLISRLQADA